MFRGGPATGKRKGNCRFVGFSGAATSGPDWFRTTVLPILWLVAAAAAVLSATVVTGSGGELEGDSMTGKATQIYGLNPFGPGALEALVPGTLCPVGIDWAEVDNLIYSTLPSSEALRDRWQAHTGTAAPEATAKLLKEEADPYILWAVSQPEVVAAQEAFQGYVAKNYIFVPGDEGRPPEYRKVLR